jgi:hypothetical protein
MLRDRWRLHRRGGDCIVATENGCNDAGGDYQGDGTMCTPGLCQAPPAGCCRGGELPESEPCGSDTNGGCNATPPTFTEADCGSVYCGSAWGDDGARDTDWYRVFLSGGGDLSGTLESDFDGVVFVVDGISSCQPIVIGDIGASGDCNPDVASATGLTPDDYVIFVATAGFDGVPCGTNNSYRVSIACGDIGPCPGLGDCCKPNDNPGCDDEACCEVVCGQDAFCCNAEWDGQCAEAAADLCGMLCEGLVNDDCDDAIAIFDGDTEYSNVDATTDGPPLPDTCDEGFGLGFGSDIWYEYEPSCTGTLTVSTCDQANYDTRLAAYVKDCDDLLLFACNDETLSLSCDGGPCQDCLGDTNGDGLVDVLDMINVVLFWGSNGQAPGINADTNGDGVVTVLDLTDVVLNWGPC